MNASWTDIENGETLLVSACLLGQSCRYDGRSKARPAVERLVEQVRSAGGQVVPVCPEELGGLGTPRPPADLRGGDGAQVLRGLARVCRVEDDGDVTAAFVTGAHEARALAPHAPRAILKARSPSCGVGLTEIDGRQQQGHGVFAALLLSEGVRVFSDEDRSIP